MNKLRGRIVLCICCIMLLSSFFAGNTIKVPADEFYDSSSYHTFSGGWLQRWYDGVNKGSHWTRYSISSGGTQREVSASIKIESYLTARRQGYNSAYVESEHKVSPYATHIHNFGD